MHKTVLTAGAALALAGCASFWPTVRTASPRPAAETFDCAANEVQALGYGVVVFDKGETLEARRIMNKRALRYNELRAYDILWFRTLNAGEGNGSTLHVRAGTITEIWTRRGPTQQDEPASSGVKRDAQAVVQKCGA